MLEFNKKFRYDREMDKEAIPLCNALNSLPGIKTIESCCGHGNEPFRIWFVVRNTDTGLFFLTRCVDHRYWEYGYLWGIDLMIDDLWFKGNKLPIVYMIHSGPIFGQLAYDQAKSLITNMNTHLNHKEFMEYYKLDIKTFKLKL
jgi:hypothetical protein